LIVAPSRLGTMLTGVTEQSTTSYVCLSPPVCSNCPCSAGIRQAMDSAPARSTRKSVSNVGGGRQRAGKKKSDTVTVQEAACWRAHSILPAHCTVGEHGGLARDSVRSAARKRLNAARAGRDTTKWRCREPARGAGVGVVHGRVERRAAVRLRRVEVSEPPCLVRRQLTQRLPSRRLRPDLLQWCGGR